MESRLAGLLVSMHPPVILHFNVSKDLNYLNRNCNRPTNYWQEILTVYLWDSFPFIKYWISLKPVVRKPKTLNKVKKSDSRWSWNRILYAEVVGVVLFVFWTIYDRPRGWVHHLWELMCFWVRGLCGGWQLALKATFNKNVLLKWDLLAGCDVSWMHPIDLAVLVVFVLVRLFGGDMKPSDVSA